MDKWFRKVAVVTGSSEGIGKDITIKLVEHGLVVVGCGRSLNKLEQVKNYIPNNSKGEFIPFQCDVSNETEVLNMFKYIEKEFNELSICINNAGIARNGSILFGETENWKIMQNVNILGLAICSREAYNLISKNQGDNPGHIINVCSILGHVVMRNQFLHYYTVTKFAVTAITEAIRQELKEINSQIKVTQISPGSVDTQFHINAGGEELWNSKKLHSTQPLVVSDVTDAIIYALSTSSSCSIQDIVVTPTID